MGEMSTAATVVELVECPLCLGRGQLQRSEILERLGVKDFARVAQLSAEEAFRLLLQKQTQDEQGRWSRFETELNKRISETNEKHRNQLQAIELEKESLRVRLQELENNQETAIANAKESQRLEGETKLQTEISELDRKVKEFEAERKLYEERKNVELQKLRNELQAEINAECSKSEAALTQLTTLVERNKELEAELAKVARVGRLEEMSFQDEARNWPGIWISDKLPRYGDFLLALRDPSGEPIHPRMVVDNKDKDAITEGDIEKIVRDAKEHKTPIAILVARQEQQLRQVDRERRWRRVDSIWLLRTTRPWLPRDLDLLKPVLEKMHAEGPDFLERNIGLAEEIRRSLDDLDTLEAELKKAEKAVENSRTLVAKYRQHLHDLCLSVTGPSNAPARDKSAPDQA